MKKMVLGWAVLSVALLACRPTQKKETAACDRPCAAAMCNRAASECRIPRCGNPCNATCETRRQTCCFQSMELNAFETIKLLPPDTLCRASLMRAAQHRKSDRDMGPRNLSLRHLSDIMWLANGVNRADGRRTVPSALALYPLQTYAVLVNGIYRYDPVAHELQPVLEGDYRQLAGLQDFVYTAPLNLLFIADFAKYQGERKVPQEKWLYLAALDAGHCTQNVYLYCAAKGLKAVVRAGAKETELLKALRLDEAQYRFVVAQSVGY